MFAKFEENINVTTHAAPLSFEIFVEETTVTD